MIAKRVEGPARLPAAEKFSAVQDFARMDHAAINLTHTGVGVAATWPVGVSRPLR